MKTIGVIGALEVELTLLKAKLDIISSRNIAGMEFYLARNSGKTVVVSRSRVGKVNAAMCAQIMIDIYGVDLIINTGVAGAISYTLEIGDIVISHDVVQHDFDTTGVGDEPYTNPSIPKSFFPAGKTLVELAERSCEKVLPLGNCAHIGRIATGDQFIMDKKHKEKILKDLGALCVEMEGGAIAQVCYLNGIDFVILRAISDKADDEAGVSFEKFAREAADRCASIVEVMIGGL